MSGRKVLALLGAILMVVLPTVGRTAYAAHPAVRLALDCAEAALGVLGFIVVPPLFGGAVAAKP